VQPHIQACLGVGFFYCMAERNSVIASFSGGKDSCLACYKAIEAGYNVRFLLNFVSRRFGRVCFHGIPAQLLKTQANLTGIKLIQHKVSANMKQYEKEFKKAVNSLKAKGAQNMVFGDIYLEEHKAWVERVCKDLGVEPIEPLWARPAEEVFKEFIGLGFKAVVTSGNAALFNKEDIGRYLDNDFLKYLKRKNICPCGENGEFHTFVVEGPLFKKRIQIQESRVVYKEGFDKRWFLDIQKYNLQDRRGK
jgi:diphthine-ammonia ligase